MSKNSHGKRNRGNHVGKKAQNAYGLLSLDEMTPRQRRRTIRRANCSKADGSHRRDVIRARKLEALRAARS